MKIKFLLPLALFVLLLVFLAVGLQRDPRAVPSPLLGRPAPAFDLPQLAQPQRRFSPRDLHGQVWLLNVWAAWCVSCRQEHPVLMDLARRDVLPIIGLDYRDERDKALEMLRRAGDPYRLSVFDGDGRVGIDYGVYGVPESYLIDRQGLIRYKHTGPLSAEVLEKTLLPLIKNLQQPERP